MGSEQSGPLEHRRVERRLLTILAATIGATLAFLVLFAHLYDAVWEGSYQQTKLSSVSALLDRMLRLEAERLLVRSALFTDDQALVAALREAPDSVPSIVEGVRERLGSAEKVALIEIADASGIVHYLSAGVGLKSPGSTLIQDALSRRTVLSGFVERDGSVFYGVALPVIADRRIIGVVSLLKGADAIVAALTGMLPGRFAVRDNQAGYTPARPPGIEELPSASLETELPSSSTVTSGGVALQYTILPLRDTRSTRIGNLFVVEDVGQSTAQREKTLWLCLAGLGFALLLSGMSLYISVFRVNRRLHATAEARIRDLESSNHRLEETGKNKQQFLANVSHEIRTPMNGILGMTELLLDSELSADQRDFAKAVRASAEALLALVNDILDYSKVESGRFTLVSMTFSLNEQLSQLSKLFQPRVDAKNVHLRFEASSGIPDVLRADSSRIRQILVNLIGNAVKFTPEGGTIVVRVREIQEQLNELTLRFEVEDSGIGIAPEHQQSIFQAFSQGDESLALQYGGTGLGLAICAQLVRLMRGEIHVESQLGKGSLFWFTVPCSVVSQGSAELYRASESAPEFADVPAATNVRSILLAEDNPVNQKLALHLLQKQGHTVTIAQNGAEAVRLSATKRFDLILMDVQMPVMDGAAATAQIRASERPGQHVPIVAVTAHAMAGDREKYLALGMDDYVTKPIDRQELFATVERWTRQRE